MKKTLGVLIIFLCVFICGCARDTASEEQRNYVHQDYIVEYGLPDWFSEDLLETDVEISHVEFELSSGSQGPVIKYIVKVNDEEYYALYSPNDGTSSNYTVARYEPEGNKIGKDLMNLPDGVMGIGKVSDEDGKLFVYDWDKVYLFDIKKEKGEMVLEFDKYNLSGNEIDTLYGTEGKIIIKRRNVKGYDYILLTPSGLSENNGSNKNEYEDKLVIATNGVNSHLLEAVYNYNMDSPTYQVEIIDYSKNALDNEDAKEKLLLSVNSSMTPDLINLCSLEEEFSDMTKKHFIADLMPLVKQSDKINLDDYYDKIAEFYSEEGKLYSIPYAYSFQTIVLNDDILCGPGWSIQEMMGYYYSNPKGTVFNYNGKNEVFNLCIFGNIKSFIDEESRVCDFDSDVFREMLSFSNEFPQKPNYKKPEEVTWEEELESKRLLSMYVYFDNVSYIQRMVGRTHSVGYPSIDGEPIVYIRPSLSGAALAICEQSDKKEAAWEFIEYYLNTPLYRFSENDVDFYGIPSNNRLLDEIISELQDENGVYTHIERDGKLNHPLTEEELEAFYELRDIAKPYPYGSQKILSIVEEESSAYFAGQKSIDEVIAIIQSRVQLYLDEHK